MITNNMFEKIDLVDDLSGVINDIFQVELDIDGGWGYDNNNPVIVNSLKMPINEFLDMFAMIRSNIEMNLMLDEEKRFSGINVNFIEGKQVKIDNKIFDVLTYEISAIKEKEYAFFIQEYKDNYGKNLQFDLNDHFERRKKSSISIQTDFWFEGLDKFYAEI